MSFYNWMKKHSFIMKTIILWMIFCVPQNIVTLIMFFKNDFEELEPPISENYTCYDVNTKEFDFWMTGISVITVATFGIFGNFFSILVLHRLAAKSSFNRLLLSLGTYFCAHKK